MNYPVVFGKYLLVDRVNVGGMAEVFKGKTFGVQGFERILAVKRILPNMAEDEEFINMFVDEARIAVQLSHSNIVQIYELGKFNEQYYIAMEYVSGRDLRQILDHFKKAKDLIPQNAACYIISKICEGLDYAHRKNDPSGKPLNFIHRDVSPQNILLSFDGDIKITDFGIAKAEDRASKTQAGVLKGKFGYMSPEQVRGLVIDRRSDIFAVGILLYEMVTGERLFLSESDFSTLEKVRNADVKPPREINPDVSPELEAVVMKALAKERDDRYPWASDLQDDLQQFLIQDNSIFSSKDLAGLMHTRYEQHINEEMQKMEQYQKMNAPKNMSSGNTAQLEMPEPNTVPSQTESNPDKTVIFESGLVDFSSAATRVGDVDSILNPSPPSAQTEAPTGAQQKPLPIDDSASASLMGEPRSLETIKKQQKRYGMLMIGATAIISLIVLLLVLIPLPGQETGTIIVTSTPSTKIEIILDGNLIGEESPLTHYDIPVGEHDLLIRAKGYTEQAFRFELAEQAPALINADLEKDSSTQAGAQKIDLIIKSQPDNAEVFIAGLPQGKTPLTLRQQNASAPLLVTLTKTDYADKTFSITFNNQDKKSGLKEVQAQLTSLNAGEDSTPAKEQPQLFGNLKIQSA
ncbi:MAG: serine/threonine-protein kinase, partial [Myxococcota bacterium]|nr:serine/threonine-protein kinase [Myxococcota bacterium]